MDGEEKMQSVTVEYDGSEQACVFVYILQIYGLLWNFVY